MNSIVIEECTLKDLSKIKDIGKRTFYETFFDENLKEDMDEYLRDNFSYAQLEKELNDTYSRFYMVQDNKEVIAYMKINLNKSISEENSEDSLEVQRIYVLQKYKGRHIGKKLIQKAIDIAKSNKQSYIWLGVWEKNINAIKFYEKQGFKKCSSHIFKLGQDEQVDNLMKLIL